MNNNIPQGYKESPLGLIPQDWEVRRLGEIGNVVSGLTYSPNDITTDNNGVLVLRSSNIQNRQLIFQDNVYVSVVRYNRVIAKDILICVRNGSRNLIGKNALITKEIEGVAFGAFMSIFRSRYNDYLIHVFDTDLFNKNVHRNLGATINSINGSDLKEFKFAIPPLAEQERIAEVLGCWDMAIEKQTALVDALIRRKRALMQQLLTARKRLPNFTAPWQKITLDSILSKLSNGLTYDTTLQSGTPVTRIETISSGVVNFDKVGYAQESNIESYKLQKDDILFSHINSIQHIGKVAIYNGEKPLYHGMNLLLVRANQKTSAKYLYYFLCSATARKKIRSLAKQAVNQASVSTADLNRWAFKHPSIEEQKAIAQILITADQEIESAKTKLEALRTQKRGLMQQLLTGKKRLKV